MHAEPPAAARAAPAKAAEPAVDWQAKLRAAHGDNAALLGLAREGAPLDVKLAAVDALTDEAALKLAERELREHDRRVHRHAKQRHLAAVARREAGEQAARLIDAATALVLEPLIPTNRLVELDRAWQALDRSQIEPAQDAAFATCLARLTALTRERGDQALKAERWSAQARQALAGLTAACAESAVGAQTRQALNEAGSAAQTTLNAAPDGDAAASMRAALQGALHTCAQLDERLEVLDALLHTPPVVAPPAAPPAAPTEASAGEELRADDAPAAPQALPVESAEPAMPEQGDSAPLNHVATRWQQLPPLADKALAQALQQRFNQWQQARDGARQARTAKRREQAKDQKRAVRGELADALASALEQGETALADGHLADTNKQLVEIDELLHGGAPAGELSARIDRLQAEYARLKGWQHWGGGLARDELVLQAEALAAAIRGDADVAIEKLTIKQQADVINDMRARWKELDRLGGASSRSLWQRFDAALKVAYQPVADHVAAQRAAREQNLLARNALVDALNAVPGPAEGDGAPDWRALAAALDHFHTEWRKLGPAEHTVPHKERESLAGRMAAAVARLDGPLSEARRVAQRERERLIDRAKALSTQAASGAQGRDVVNQSRELQAEWQIHAKALPLARAAENALWAEFRAAIDALFAARDAAFNARDAEFKAYGVERAALIERLEGITASTPAAELKRTLAEVDAQWQRIGPAPRSDAAALDARFRSAREAATQLQASSAQRAWHATCDALIAKLALCEEVERSADAEAAKALVQQGWPAQPALPAVWEQALTHRASLVPAPQSPGVHAAVSTDDLLLQLEMTLELDSPPAFQAARRELKLQALKAALEGRSPASTAQPALNPLLAAALGRNALDEAQRQRLNAVIAALRNREPLSTVV